jgi:non-canonical poly(A) RNA polymerase PAPD5/7
MLCLRDPADPTNDLGRKAVAIKHVQQTLKVLYYTLDRDVRMNTRTSLLSTLIGPSYMLYQARRHKLAEYGKWLSDENKKHLAVQAREVREGAKSLESQREEKKENNIQQITESAKSLESQSAQKEENGFEEIRQTQENIQQYLDNIQLDFENIKYGKKQGQESERPPL